MPDTTLFRSPRSAAGHAFPARHRQRHDDSRVDDGGVEVPAAPHTAARTGAVCAYGHFRAEPFDLAGGSLDGRPVRLALGVLARSEEHTSELQSLMRISYSVFCLKKKTSKTWKK